MSQVVAASRVLDPNGALTTPTYLENELRGTLQDFQSYMAANPRVPLGPVRVKTVVEQEVT